MGVPYTGCDARASRISFDKVLTKKLCIAAGVPTAPFTVIGSPNEGWPGGWKPPVVVKPVCQGSSVGLQFVERVEDWGNALAEALRFDSRVLVEERILGRECTVGILDDVVLPIVEVRPRNGAYDYRNKYTVGATDYFCPAPFDAATTKRIRSAAVTAFHAVGGRDYARVDVMVRENGEPVVLEVNTQPGMTETSLLPKAAGEEGIDYAELCQRMLDMALKRAASVAFSNFPFAPNNANTVGRDHALSGAARV
jgi:D-alanine-D-alanine ligase